MLPGILGFAGRSSVPPGVTLVHTGSSSSEVANYGEDFPGRWIVILAVGGNTTTAYDLGATISGAGGTTIKAHSTGNGAGLAIGTGIIVGQPSGTSGTVTITASAGSPPRSFYALSVAGYNMGSAVYSDDSTGAGIPPWTGVVNIPANGLLLGIAGHNAAISWTGVTERITDDTTIISPKTFSAAWDFNLSSNPTATVDVTASDTQGVSSAIIATFNPS